MGSSPNQGPFGGSSLNKGAVLFWGDQKSDPNLENYPNETRMDQGRLAVYDKPKSPDPAMTCFEFSTATLGSLCACLDPRVVWYFGMGQSVLGLVSLVLGGSGVVINGIVSPLNTGGSWGVINGVIGPLIWVISIATQLYNLTYGYP